MNLSETRARLSKLVVDNNSAFEKYRKRLFDLMQLFLDTYGDGDVSLLRAPARINILGEHIDYVSYLPTASLTFGSREHDALMLYRKSDKPEIRGMSTAKAYGPSSFPLSEAEVPEATEELQSEWL